MIVELTGVAEMLDSLDNVGKEFDKRLKAALRLESELVMTDAKVNFVPVGKTGNLRSSGHVTRVTKSTDGYKVSMQFGGPSAPYALAIHEHPSESSPPTWKGKTIKFKRGGHKFLHIPLMNAVQGMDTRIAQELRG